MRIIKYNWKRIKREDRIFRKIEQYCFNRMPFWIAAAPGTFQEFMGKVLEGIKYAVVYLDDILVFTDTINKHYEVLKDVFSKVVNLEKCHILKKEVNLLEHVINRKQ